MTHPLHPLLQILAEFLAKIDPTHVDLVRFPQEPPEYFA